MTLLQEEPDEMKNFQEVSNTNSRHFCVVGLYEFVKLSNSRANQGHALSFPLAKLGFKPVQNVPVHFALADFNEHENAIWSNKNPHFWRAVK